MTPKEKAEKLVDTYRNTIMSFLNDNMKDMNAKNCALVAVNEVINVLEEVCDDRGYDPFEAPLYRLEEWKEVRQELVKDEDWANTSGMYQKTKKD
jgi:hypothetical protein